MTAHRPRAARWPLHPRPSSGEALSSWLTRIGAVYGLTLTDLVEHNLHATGREPASGSVRRDLAWQLDLDPGLAFITALHERTGVDHDQLRQMTVAGWAPWLLDRIHAAEPGDTNGDRANTDTFTTFVQQDSVLFPPGRVIRRQLPGWRPWIPAAPLRRGCPTCSKARDGHGGPPAHTLIAQLPITLSCPHHGCGLAPVIGYLDDGRTAWANDIPLGDTPDPIAAHPAVVAMDRRTHQALTTGQVSLPGRSVHLGVWFRLLRTLLDELSTPTSKLGTGSRAAVQRIWAVTGDRPAAGRWRPYEALPWNAQQTMLRAAAFAMQLAETGAVIAHGSLGVVVRDGPHPAVYDGDAATATRPSHLASASCGGHAWHDLASRVLDDARADPGKAAALLTMLSFGRRWRHSYELARDSLIAGAVPAEWLPTWAEAATLDEREAARVGSHLGRRP